MGPMRAPALLLALCLLACATARVPVERREVVREALRLERERRHYRQRQQDRIERIGLRLLEHVPVPLEVTFRYSPRPVVNAYTDGRRVVVCEGLLAYVDSEDELACVIAHELGHVLRQHLKRQRLLSLGVMLPLSVLDALLSAYAGVRVDLLSALGQQALLGYMRDQESEADFFGTLLAWQAGYDPDKLVDFFEKLAVRLGDTGLNVYNRTHPPTPQRRLMVRREAQALREGRLVPELAYSLFLGTPVRPGAFTERQLLDTCRVIGLKVELHGRAERRLALVRIARGRDKGFLIEGGRLKRLLMGRELGRALRELGG